MLSVWRWVNRVDCYIYNPKQKACWKKTSLSLYLLIHTHLMSLAACTVCQSMNNFMGREIVIFFRDPRINMQQYANIYTQDPFSFL